MKINKTGLLSGLVVAGSLFASISSASADTIKVGIANFGDHPQLNAAIAGFKEAMAENGFVEGPMSPIPKATPTLTHLWCPR